MLATIIGSLAAFLTASSQLPQLIKIIKSRHTKDISLPTYLAITIAAFLWVIYGLYLQNLIIISTNVVTFLFVFVIVCFKFKYK